MYCCATIFPLTNRLPLTFKFTPFGWIATCNDDVYVFKLFIDWVCKLLVVNETDADTANALADVNKLAVVTCKEVVYELCTNPVPVTSVLILDVILAEVCCIFSFILDDKKVVVVAILADKPLLGSQTEADNAEPVNLNWFIEFDAESLADTNSPSVANPAFKLLIIFWTVWTLLSIEAENPGNWVVTNSLLWEILALNWFIFVSK